MTLENAKKKPLRIALIASEHTFTEYRTFLGHLLVGLTDQSVPVALVCPEQSNLDSIVLAAAEVIRYHSFNMPLVAHLNRKLVIDSLTKFKPHILHCLSEAKASFTRQLARRLELPYVLMVNSQQNRWRRLAVSQKRCARITVPTRSIAASIAENYPRFAGIIQQINIGSFTVKSSSCFSEPSRTPTIVMSHPFRRAEEFEKLFSALRHLRIEGHEFMIVVIGGGRAETQLWKLLAATDLLPITTIIPRATPRRSVISTGDIFIRPQPSAAFDCFLLEAMSAGLAVAGCRGGVDDLIIENETAVIFDPNDELSIVATLQQLFSKRELARKIAKNAQEHLKKDNSVSNMISAYLELYNEIHCL